MLRTFRRLCVLILALAIILAQPREACAVDRDVRSMLASGAYGILGGTLVGLLSYPAHRSTRGIFLGSSIGLYLGTAVGIYHITHRDDPNNPLRREPGATDLSEIPSAVPEADWAISLEIANF